MKKQKSQKSIKLQSQLKLLGHFAVFLPPQCWCARFGELTAINNTGRVRRQAKTEQTALGGNVPSIFLETVVINYFPHSFRLCSHFSDSSCSDTKNHMFTHNSDLANLKVDCHISGKFLEQTSRALDWIACFPNNIICWISRNYLVDSRKWYAYLFNWAYEVGEKLKKTFLTMSMNTALRDRNAKPFVLEFPD